ncbi:hypothetical protein AB0L88_09360 [Saccharopolyspora shandongensis]|uniref:hypothetical protein n=1 Tax=Saccharopolyspora shandongensis TaxID=418495 RepID=UPI00342DBEC1
MSKSGRTAAENEDSCAADAARGRFAVADGASTSARPEIWSRLLVDAFVRDRLDPLAPDVLGQLREQWWQQVWAPDLPWFAHEKLLLGAAAAFVGLCVSADPGVADQPSATNRYRARAVGDSCLLHLRGHRVLVAGPLDRPAGFSRFVELLHSGRQAPPPADAVWEVRGTFRPGDVFVLASDTAAKNLLAEYTECGYAPEQAKRLARRSLFDDFVAQVRDSGQNDDMTVCVVGT